MVHPSYRFIYQQNKMPDSVRETPGPVGKGGWQVSGGRLRPVSARLAFGVEDNYKIASSQDCWEEDLCPL